MKMKILTAAVIAAMLTLTACGETDKADTISDKPAETTTTTATSEEVTTETTPAVETTVTTTTEATVSLTIAETTTVTAHGVNDAGTHYSWYVTGAPGVSTALGVRRLTKHGNEVGLSYVWHYITSRVSSDGLSAPHRFNQASHALMIHLLVPLK